MNSQAEIRMSAEADSFACHPTNFIQVFGGVKVVPYWRLHYHLVWATLKRKSLIWDDQEQAISRSFQLTCGDMGLICHAVGIMPDHVHMAVSIPPRHSISEVMKRLKGASSHAVRATDPSFTWQSEYGALSFDDRALSSVCDDVERHHEHHAAGTTISRLERIESESNGFS